MMSCKIHTAVISKSTSEQLRSDHIELLEALHSLKTENDRLKNAMKQRTEKYGSNREEGKGTGDHEASALQEMDPSVMKASMEKISSYENEIKVLKLRLSQSDLELLRYKQQSSLSNADLSKHYAGILEKVKKQCGDEYRTIIDQLKSELRITQLELMEMRSIGDEYEQLRGQMTASQTELMHRTNELRALFDCNEDLKGEIELLRASNSESNEMLHRKVMDFNALKHTDNLMISSKNQEILGITSKLQQQSSENRELKDIIRTHIAEISTLKQEALTFRDRCSKAEQTIEEMKIIMTEKDRLITMHSNAADGNDLTFHFTSFAQPAQQEQASNNTIRFEEFLFLKRENKELKLRLADAGHESRPVTVNLDSGFSTEQSQQKTRNAMLGNNYSTSKNSPSKLPNKLRKSVTNRRY